jgi:hypothetical protein
MFPRASEIKWVSGFEGSIIEITRKKAEVRCLLARSSTCNGLSVKETARAVEESSAAFGAKLCR